MKYTDCRVVHNCSSLVLKLQNSVCGAVLEQPLLSCCLCPVYVVARHIRPRPWGAATLSSLSGGADLVPGFICCFATRNLLAMCNAMMLRNTHHTPG